MFPQRCLTKLCGKSACICVRQRRHVAAVSCLAIKADTLNAQLLIPDSSSFSKPPRTLTPWPRSPPHSADRREWRNIHSPSSYITLSRLPRREAGVKAHRKWLPDIDLGQGPRVHPFRVEHEQTHLQALASPRCRIRPMPNPSLGPPPAH